MTYLDNFRPCSVATCTALRARGDRFCSTHVGAKRAEHVLVGQKCVACGRALESGDWITRASTQSEMTHAVCPPKRPAPTRKVDRAKPLLEAAERQA